MERPSSVQSMLASVTRSLRASMSFLTVCVEVGWGAGGRMGRVSREVGVMVVEL
jgi:hypothetical protein